MNILTRKAKGTTMGHKFAELAFTPEVKAAQERNGSRRAYARMEAGEDHHDVLGPSEAGFIAARDNPSVLMRSIQDIRLALGDATH